MLTGFIIGVLFSVLVLASDMAIDTYLSRKLAPGTYESALASFRKRNEKLAKPKPRAGIIPTLDIAVLGIAYIIVFVVFVVGIDLLSAMLFN